MNMPHLAKIWDLEFFYKFSHAQNGRGHMGVFPQLKFLDPCIFWFYMSLRVCVPSGKPLLKFAGKFH